MGLFSNLFGSFGSKGGSHGGGGFGMFGGGGGPNMNYYQPGVDPAIGAGKAIWGDPAVNAAENIWGKSDEALAAEGGGGFLGGLANFLTSSPYNGHVDRMSGHEGYKTRHRRSGAASHLGADSGDRAWLNPEFAAEYGGTHTMPAGIAAQINEGRHLQQYPDVSGQGAPTGGGPQLPLPGNGLSNPRDFRPSQRGGWNVPGTGGPGRPMFANPTQSGGPLPGSRFAGGGAPVNRRR